MGVRARINRAMRLGRVLQTGGGPSPRGVYLLIHRLFSCSLQHPVFNTVLARGIQTTLQDEGLPLL
jgi:hypothetical protein